MCDMCRNGGGKAEQGDEGREEGRLGWRGNEGAVLLTSKYVWEYVYIIHTGRDIHNLHSVFAFFICICICTYMYM